MTTKSLSQISINPENVALLKKKEGYGQEYFTDTTQLIDILKICIWIVVILLVCKCIRI